MVKTIIQTPLGDMVATSDGVALTGLWFVGQRYFPKCLPGDNEPGLAVFEKTQGWLDCYFAGTALPAMPVLAPKGTAFQCAVWVQLQTVAYGQTTTYGAMGAALGKPKAGQAIGGAVGHNPISILIPCHRVVGANGNLTGYAGGLDRKVALLELEKSK